MVKLTSTCGLIITFKMTTDAKEKSLVDQFQLGFYTNNYLLNLKQYGTISVDHIEDLTYIKQEEEMYININDLGLQWT